MDKNLIGSGFQIFMTETPEYSQPWMEMVYKLSISSGLDDKTKALAYLAVLAATPHLAGGVAYHVKHAKELGATRQEVIGAILVGLPAVGHGVTNALGPALEIYDQE
jgi:alkylhydroperoxidase/carboxymuconolactone decarboxylase family protein YurZ